MRNVADIGIVEEVVVFAELEICTPVLKDFHYVGDHLDVAFAEDGGRTNGAGEEGCRSGGGGTCIGGKDEFFCLSLFCAKLG